MNAVIYCVRTFVFNSPVKMKLFESENAKIYYFCQAAMAYRQTILLLEFHIPLLVIHNIYTVRFFLPSYAYLDTECSHDTLYSPVSFHTHKLFHSLFSQTNPQLCLTPQSGKLALWMEYKWHHYVIFNLLLQQYPIPQIAPSTSRPICSGLAGPVLFMENIKELLN